MRTAARLALLIGAAGILLPVTYVAAPIPYIVPASDVAAIEKYAERDPCVGALSAWSRTYRFAGSAGQPTPDFDTVTVSFKDPNVRLPGGALLDAGVHRPWRNSLIFGSAYVDHRQQRTVFGIYDRRHHAVTSWRCGCNADDRSWSALPQCGAR